MHSIKKIAFQNCFSPMQICRTIYIVFSASGNIISLKTENQLQVFLAISFVSFYVFRFFFVFFFFFF